LPTESRLGKGPIESGMFSAGRDTIPGHVPVQGTELRMKNIDSNIVKKVNFSLWKEILDLLATKLAN